MAGDQSEMEAMLQVERSKIKTRVENTRVVKVRRYTRNFASSDKVVDIDINDREALDRYAQQL